MPTPNLPSPIYSTEGAARAEAEALNHEITQLFERYGLHSAMCQSAFKYEGGQMIVSARLHGCARCYGIVLVKILANDSALLESTMLAMEEEGWMRSPGPIN